MSEWSAPSPRGDGWGEGGARRVPRATHERTRRPRSRLRPAYPALAGNQPDRGRAHPPPRPPGPGGPRRPAPERRHQGAPDPFPAADPVLVRQRPAAHPARRRMAGRRPDAAGPCPDVRLLPQRAAAAPAARERRPRGPVRPYNRDPRRPGPGSDVEPHPAPLRTGPSVGTGLCPAPGPPGRRRRHRPGSTLRLRTGRRRGAGPTGQIQLQRAAPCWTWRPATCPRRPRLAEGKLLMRTLLAHYLGDKPLATRQLLIDLQKL